MSKTYWTILSLVTICCSKSTNILVLFNNNGIFLIAANIHRLSNGIIAEFIHRGPKSFFQEVLKSRSGDLNIDFKVSLKVTAVDKEIENLCRQLREAKRIDSYMRDMVSGKIVIIKNNKRRSINSDNDLMMYWQDEEDQSSISSTENLLGEDAAQFWFVLVPTKQHSRPQQI